MGSRAKSKDGSGGGDRFTTSSKIFGPGRKRGGQPTEHKGLYKRDGQEEVGSYKSGEQSSWAGLDRRFAVTQMELLVKAQGMMLRGVVTELFRSHSDAITLIWRLLLIRGTICSCAICVSGALWVHRLFDLLET